MTSEPTNLEGRLLRVLHEASQPLRARDLARLLGVEAGELPGFRSVLGDLEREGRVYRTRGNRYAVPQQIHLVVGRIQWTRHGDAWLIPGPGEGEGTKDLFIPAGGLDSALDGDHVVARIEGTGRDGRPFGSVVRILERGRPTIVGTLRRARRVTFVEPVDRRMPRDVLVPEGEEGEAREGDVVVLRITAYGDRRLPPVGTVERVLGARGTPGVDVLSIFFGHGLPLEFPPQVEAAAEEAAGRADGADPHRVDRRDLLVFTIDPADARDHDDALSIVPLPMGRGWEVGIHIADVSWFVRPGTVLDAEALRRGTSVYLVDRVVPMLPHRLSSDLCSLVPDQDRLALSLFVRIDESGALLEHRLERTWIRSRQRLSYEDAQEVIDGARSVDPEVDAALAALARLADRLRGRRMARGSLDFDLPEARVVLDPEGVPLSIERRLRVASHRLIEEFMLLANEVVAQEAEDRKIPIPYRIHEPPESSRIELLRETLESMGYRMPAHPPTPGDFQTLLRRVTGKPEENLLSMLVLRSMRQARYDPGNVGHFGLASRAYAHFTSPIRRYPDLLLHRALVEGVLEGSAQRSAEGEVLRTMARHSSERERVAERAERDSIELKKIEYMERHLGEEFDGTISGVTSFGFFVLLRDVFVDGLVHVSSLGDDFYRFEEREHALVGERRGRRFRLGDPVRVRVARLDRAERRIDFVLAGGSPGRPPHGPSREAPGSGRRGRGPSGGRGGRPGGGRGRGGGRPGRRPGRN